MLLKIQSEYKCAVSSVIARLRLVDAEQRLILYVSCLLDFLYLEVQSSIFIPSNLSKSLTFLVAKIKLLEIAVAPISKSKSSNSFPFFLSSAFSFHKCQVK